MNNIDLELFGLLQTLPRHPRVSEYITDKGYSDINVQDDLGNTFFHYLFKNHGNVELLLKNGANPYIRNKEGKNGLTYTPENIHKFWEGFKDYKLNLIFRDKTKGYHPALIQSIFNFLVRENNNYVSPQSCSEFLATNNLNTLNNLASFLVFAKNIPLSRSVDYFVDQSPSPENNMFFLNEVLSRFSRDLNEPHQCDKLIQFMEKSQFTVDSRFCTTLLSYSYGNIPEEFLDKLIAVAVKNADLKEKFYKRRNEYGEFCMYSYHEGLSERPRLANIYLNYLLEKDLRAQPQKLKKIKI